MTPLPLIVAAALASNPVDECPGGRKVTFEPKAGRKAFKAAKTAKELEPLLRALALKTAEMASSCVEREPSRAEVDVFKAALFSGEKRDLVVQVRGWMCGAKLLDGVVLRRAGGEANAWCAFPLPFLPGLVDMEYLGEHKLTFGFVNLTDANRQTVRLDSYESQHGTGMVEEGSTSFHDVDPKTGAFRELFALGWSSGRGGFTSESWSTYFKVSVVEDAHFPRKLKVEERGSLCPGPYKQVPTPSGEVAVPSDGECTTASETYLACLEGARYGRCN
jgi:hypothetical protein